MTQAEERIGESVQSAQDGIAKIVQYNKSSDVSIMFVNDGTIVNHIAYASFKKGLIRNPNGIRYSYGIGKFHFGDSKQFPKEFQTYADMCFRTTADFLVNNPTYKDIKICDEWLNDFYSFRDWLYSQDNYNFWLNGSKWCLDKDILFKHNKLYSPDTCTLVPTNVNTIFVKKDQNRGEFPIGVCRNHKRYMAMYSNPITGQTKTYLGTYDTPEEAFYAYKKAKETIIKQVAEIEYGKHHITKQCYEAMMRYEVEITD